MPALAERQPTPPRAPGAPRVIQFEGRTLHVPADFTDDEIKTILSAPPQAAPPAVPPADFAKIKRNIGRMIDQKASESEIDAYVAGEGVTPEQLRAAAPAAGIVEVEGPGGVIVEFPAGTPREVMEKAMRTRFGGPAAAPGAPRGAVPTTAPSVPESPRPENVVRAGSQGGLRGVADIVGLLPDVANMGANALLASADFVSRKVSGPEIGFRFPLASDSLARQAAEIGKAFGYESLDPEKMSTPEKFTYNVNRFGTQAALSAGTLAPIAASRAALGAARTPKLGDALMRAYERAPASVAVGDVAANALGGATLTASQSLPKETRDAAGGTVGAIADLLAMLTGQVAGGTLANLKTAPRRVVDRVQRTLPARDIPYDPATGAPTTNRQADLAARYVQANAADPREAAAAINAGADEFLTMGAPVPAAGALSNDPKLLTLERAVRTGAPGEFAARDVALRDAALGAVESIQPQGVDPRVATNFLRDAVNARTGKAADALRTAEGRLAVAEDTQRAAADPYRLFAGRTAPASEALDQLVLEKSLRPMDTARRADFAAVPRDATVPGEPFVEAAGRVRASAQHLPENARAEVLPQKRLEDFESYIIRDSAGKVAGVKPMTFGTINDLRPILGSEIARARKAGAPATYLDNLETLRRELNKATDALPEAKTAMENYKTTYAPVWGRGAGETHRFRSDFNVDRVNRTASPPTATAGRFLTTGAGAKEKAASLARVVETIADPTDKAAAVAAVREHVLADMTKTIGADGKIAETSLARWLHGPAGWGDALSQFPTVRAEVEKLLSDVRAGNAQRNTLALGVERAARGLKRTQYEIDNSALSLTLGKEPIKAARAVLDSGDPQVAMREIVGAIGPSGPTRDAWKRAVSDHLVDRISTVNPGAVSEGGAALDYGKLTRAFKQYEGALAEVYSPGEMNALRRAQKMLEPLAKRAGPTASQTPELGEHQTAWKLVELALKAHYGILKGGGVVRTFKIAAGLLASDAAGVQRLVARMMFDPELATHLLTRKVAEVGTPLWNANLAKLLRRAEAGREVLGGERE